MTDRIERRRAAARLQQYTAIALTSAGLLAGASASQGDRSCADRGALDRNKVLVEGFFQDVFAARSVEAAQRYLRPNYIQHSAGIPGGLAGFQAFFRPQFEHASPGVQLQILHVIAEGDLVNIHLRWFGTTNSGKPVDVTEFDLFRIEEGLIAEHWDAVGSH